ncbi:hypothetical protein QCA50_019128 [Cerrena zonata]|uniref:Uncharacterized protein n=1 Tax=Cerrena zonata TaxID=2478898 RepID=A0AAW0F9Y4_9APHY
MPHQHVFDPNNRFIPVVHVTCTARSTDLSQYPSVFNDPQNPTIRQPMLVQLRESVASGGWGSMGYVARIRSINKIGIELQLFGVSDDNACLYAHLMVPHNRAIVSNDQYQLHRSIQFWNPATADSPSQYQAMVDYARANHAPTEVQGRLSSVPDLTGNILFSPLEVPPPTFHHVVPPHHKSPWFEY